MMRCSHCGVDRETVLDPDLLFVSCPWCGKVLDQVYHASRRKKFGKRTSNEVFYGRDEDIESLTDVDDFEKKTQKKPAAGNRNSATTKSPPEGSCQVLKRRSFSSKINYKVLESLEEDSTPFKAYGRTIERGKWELYNCCEERESKRLAKAEEGAGLAAAAAK